MLVRFLFCVFLVRFLSAGDTNQQENAPEIALHKPDIFRAFQSELVTLGKLDWETATKASAGEQNSDGKEKKSLGVSDGKNGEQFVLYELVVSSVDLFLATETKIGNEKVSVQFLEHSKASVKVLSTSDSQGFVKVIAEVHFQSIGIMQNFPGSHQQTGQSPEIHFAQSNAWFIALAGAVFSITVTFFLTMLIYIVRPMGLAEQPTRAALAIEARLAREPAREIESERSFRRFIEYCTSTVGATHYRRTTRRLFNPQKNM